VNYIGSKHSLLNFIDESVQKVTSGKFSSVCDIFAGTGAVGKFYKAKGKKIIANDIQYYSYVLNRNYIGNHKPLLFCGLCEEIPKLSSCEIALRKNLVCKYLNELNGIDGFIYNNYCFNGLQANGRMYYSDNNGKKCDAIRQKIEYWKNIEAVNDDEYYFLLASLIEAIDKVANTASVYGAYLKKLKKSAQKELNLISADFFANDRAHAVFNDDANKIINDIECDVLYLDPPYNQRQYDSNYHLLETIARYDNPIIAGKTGLRQSDAQKSKYCSRNKVKQELKDLVQKTKAKYIFLSYNNEGLLSLDDIREILSERGKYGVFERRYNRFKADIDKNRSYTAKNTTEYLHYAVIK
jgi:adenine-specific DNA-methyltransferase